MSPLALGATALGAIVVARYAFKPRPSSDSGSSSQGHIVLEVLFGPNPDPCLGEAYSQTGQPLLPEAYAGVSDAAKALYWEQPVFFITPAVQAAAFMKIAALRVNQPFVEPVIKVARDLAPNCRWLDPIDEWSDAMVAFRDSLEKMTQIIDVDIGDVPALYRPHAWETEDVLRDGRELLVADRSIVNFELPPGLDELALHSTVTPEGPVLTTLGIHDQKVPNGAGGYKLVPVLKLRPNLGHVQSPAQFQLTATRQSGAQTTANLEVAPKYN